MRHTCVEQQMLTRHIIESELTPFYPRLGTTVWSPLAGGVLSGKVQFFTVTHVQLPVEFDVLLFTELCMTATNVE